MAEIKRGKTAGALAAEVLVELKDPTGRRSPVPVIIQAFSDAIRDLADWGIFTRTDLVVPTAGQRVFRCLAELVEVLEVRYNGKGLEEAPNSVLRGVLGADWRTSPGTPMYFTRDPDGVRLARAPELAGTDLVAGTPPADVPDGDQGSTIMGNGWWCTEVGGANTYFKPGDGSYDNDEDAENNVWLEYAYQPRPCTEDTVIPARLLNGIRHYAKWYVRKDSRLEEQLRLATADWDVWQEQMHKVTGGPEFDTGGTISLGAEF